MILLDTRWKKLREQIQLLPGSPSAEKTPGSQRSSCVPLIPKEDISFERNTQDPEVDVFPQLVVTDGFP
jgi:hypothetical protein